MKKVAYVIFGVVFAILFALSEFSTTADLKPATDIIVPIEALADGARDGGVYILPKDITPAEMDDFWMDLTRDIHTEPDDDHIWMRSWEELDEHVYRCEVTKGYPYRDRPESDWIIVTLFFE